MSKIVEYEHSKDIHEQTVADADESFMSHAVPVKQLGDAASNLLLTNTQCKENGRAPCGQEWLITALKVSLLLCAVAHTN